MRMIKLLFAAAVIMVPDISVSQVYKPVQKRVVQTINADWTFNYFPTGQPDTAKAGMEFDDSLWKAIALPHTWQTYETTGDIHPFIMAASERVDPYWWNGWGWYRKRVVVEERLRGKKILAEFDGVQKYCRVYLNGHLLGEHKGGYTGFYFDLTPHIVYGRENVIAVEVSNRRDDKFGVIPPSTAGNFDVYGGIYRDVRIVVTEPVYVPFQGSYKHEGGTFITTPAVSDSEARAVVKTFVGNDSGSARNITVKSIITGSDGRVVKRMESSQTVENGTIATFEQHTGAIKNPELWSQERPSLYSVHTEVWSEGHLSDTYLSPLGFRYFHWDYTDNTLVVNGRKTHIHGTNRHQEYPWLGDAIPKWLTYSDFDDIRYNLGHNFMRAGHYPNDPIVYDYSDRNGIVMVEEVPNIKSIDFDERVQEQNLREMIRRDRNHPSIMFWSVGNETSDAADSRWVVEEDTTRYIHERKSEGYGDYVNHTARNLDMENLLRVTIRGWYNRDVRDLEPGRGSKKVAKSGQQAGTEEWQHRMARVDGGSIRGRIDKNIVAWIYNDHGADRIYKDSPLKNINAKGWVDAYRVPKYMYYLWQANYLDRGMIFIHPHHWREQYLGRAMPIQVDSNCDEVELFVNGRSVGRQRPSKENFFTVEFPEVPVERGVISAEGTRRGEKVRYSITMAGAPAQLTLTASHVDIAADRSGIVVVTADIIDKAGVHVYGATHPLTWEVSGEGTLVGCPLYETDINKKSELSGTGYIDAPVSNVVRSTNRPGTITVRVSSPGLEPATVTIRTQAVKRSATGISEPRLDDEGRRGVVRDTAFCEKVVYEIEMRGIVTPFDIEASSDDEYREAMIRFVLDRNPNIDSRSVEFTKLADRLTSYIINTRGELTEDDYNFFARAYNDARMLARLIEARNFHPDYAASLREYYSTALLVDGTAVDIGLEAGHIASIPRDADTMIMIESDADTIEYERTRYFYRVFARSFERAVELMRPQYSSFSPEEKRQAMQCIDAINPGVHLSGNIYTVNPEMGIAIPKNLKPN